MTLQHTCQWKFRAFVPLFDGMQDKIQDIFRKSRSRPSKYILSWFLSVLNKYWCSQISSCVFLMQSYTLNSPSSQYHQNYDSENHSSALIVKWKFCGSSLKRLLLTDQLSSLTHNSHLRRNGASFPPPCVSSSRLPFLTSLSEKYKSTPKNKGRKFKLIKSKRKMFRRSTTLSGVVHKNNKQ